MEYSERAMELEALSAIFMEGEELEVINENEIMLVCGPQRQDGTKMSSMKLKFILPDGYPSEESLQYNIVEYVGLDAAAGERIRALIDVVIKRNQGAPMVYPIVEAVNEELVKYETTASDPGERAPSNTSEEHNANTTVQAKDNANLDTGLQLKQLCSEQERVTQEIFEEWSKNFRLEMISKGIWRDVDAGKNHNQMTGRQIFESKLVDIELDENENVFWHDEALYQGECDVESLE